MPFEPSDDYVLLEYLKQAFFDEKADYASKLDLVMVNIEKKDTLLKLIQQVILPGISTYDHKRGCN